MSTRFAFIGLFLGILSAHAELKIATFDVDASPPSGSQLMYDPFKGNGELTLRCRGIVLTGAGAPIVLCAVDWIGIANESHRSVRETLAQAAGTTAERVTLHVLHQHDAPVMDSTAEKILQDAGVLSLMFDSAVTQPTIQRVATAIRESIPKSKPVTHLGFGKGEVKEVASNRRVMGTDGKVKAVRYTSCQDPALRAEPEGTIDPNVAIVSFWNGDQAICALSYYATHPQSYYRTGLANPDFPGIARFLRDQALPGVLHIHFNGAGGNIGAGKYNDGSPTNRAVLAKRLAEGMARAWAATEKRTLASEEVSWHSESVSLPAATHLDSQKLKAELQSKTPAVYVAAAKLAWLQQCQQGSKIDVSSLWLGSTRLLHLPGEIFVEYQLAAQKLHPNLQVATAGYGNYGPGYIGTEIAYTQGGYEVEPNSSLVAPSAEKVLMEAIQRALTGKPSDDGP